MYYFVSDVHLGGGSKEEALDAETRFVKWLDSVAQDATGIFICGDLFDFWYEYKRVVPKGFVRTLGRLAHLTQRGVRVVFIAGNHDQWVRDYLSVECGVEIYTTPQIFEVANKRIYVAHGDNLNIKNDPLLKFMNNGFRSPWIRGLFSMLVHPDLALKFGQWWSRTSRNKHINCDHQGRDKAMQMLVEHACNIHTQSNTDYHIFGHIHLAKDYTSEGGIRVIFMNDWSECPHVAVMNELGEIRLEEV
ncbi:MAG: UDP-2,3-diacylglucosamine diphosphatase [Rikenellaceae bacterium]